MKRIIFIFSLLLLCATSMRAQQVSFKFQDGLYDTNLRNQMENTISALLTEFNNAYREHRRLNFNGINISDKAQRSLTFTWDSLATFTCDFDRNICHCLTTVTGYEVREIYITYHPRNPAEYTGAKERELSIGFIKEYGKGLITHAHPTLEDDANLRTLMKGSSVIDMQRRLQILNFVEQFRSFYDNKDLNALDQIYSDDALIITGKVIKRAPRNDAHAELRPEIVYNKQNKTQYINSLRGIFARNKYIRVKFEDIQIMSHPARDNFYGVTLKQNWRAMNANQGVRYEDDGYLFLLWEFPDNEPPKVHVRTWQPELIDAFKNEKIAPDEVFDCNDFFIPDDGRK